MTKAQIKLPPKLIPVFRGEARYRGSWGGRGSAKTRSFALMASVKGYQLGRSGIEGQILCGREFMNSLAESSFQEVKMAIKSVPWLDAYYECGDRYIRSKDGRITFTFTGLRLNIDSIKSKARILLAWVDEAEGVSDEAWVKLIPTVREHNSEIWVTWNPEFKHSATNQRFRVNATPDMKIVEMNWSDNPWFPEVLERERLRDKEMRPDQYDHIWEGAYKDMADGAIYAKQLKQAREDGRITEIPIEPVEVITFWDLGRNDHTAIWFMQRVGLQNRFIDYYENRLVDLEHYARVLKEKDYLYAEHYMPHDVEVQVLGMNQTRRSMFEDLGVKPIEVVPRVSHINTGIEQTRKAFASAWFDEKRCEKGLDALSNYQYVYDEKHGTHRQTPLHNWASNGADAFRQYGQGFSIESSDWGEELNYPNMGYA